jgi:hypothetical protein
VDAPAGVVGAQVRARGENAYHGDLVGPPPLPHHRAQRLEALAPQPSPRVRREQRAPGSRRLHLRVHLVERHTSQSRLAALAIEADEAVLHVLVSLEPELHDVRLHLPPLFQDREPGARLEDERERVVVWPDSHLQHVNVQAQSLCRVAVADVAAHQRVVVEGLRLVQRREDGGRKLHAAHPARERAGRQQWPRVPRGAVQAQLDVPCVVLPDLVEAQRRDCRRRAAWLRLLLLAAVERRLCRRRRRSRRGGSCRGGLVGLRLRKH